MTEAAAISDEPSISGSARNHHWIPQCYLRGFTGADGKLFVVDGRQGKTFHTVPAKVAVKRDFNRISEDQEHGNVVESEYAKFETRLSASLRNIQKSRALDSISNLGLIIDLIAILAVRGPRMRLAHKRMAELQAYSRLRRAIHLRPGTGEAVGILPSAVGCPNDEGLSGHIVLSSLSVNVPTAKYVRMELDLASEIRPYLTSRQWVLVCAGKDSGGFVTTDDPVTLVGTSDASGGKVPLRGFARRDNDVIFPVSRDLAIAGRFTGANGTCAADRERVALINGWVIRHAWQQVYARDEQCPYVVDEARGIQGVSDLIADMARTDRDSDPL